MAHLAAEMGLLQGSVFCPAVHGKQAGARKILPYTSVLKASRGNGSGFMGGSKVIESVKMPSCSQGRKNTVKCSLYSSSNESNSMAGNFKEDDTCYVNASVVEAVEVKSSSDGFMVMMKDGEHLRCVHNNPQSRHQPEHDWQPATVLKMEDGTDLFLPILASEIPSMQLMAAAGDVRIATRSMYEVVQEMTEKMGYAVKMVRVTDRVCGSYFAQLHLTKEDNKSEGVALDLQPSDAINIAMRCKAPIQVNRFLASSDGLRVTETSKSVIQRNSSKELFSAELDRPTDEKCVDAKEFILLRNMLLAAIEERYVDAAQWRDQLNRLRSTWTWMFV